MAVDRQWITPENEEHWLMMRHGCITSTEASALMGMSPYATAFEIWHQKKADKPPVFNSNERMEWGNRLEGTIALGVSQTKEWEVEPLKDYCLLPELKMGSSFDYKVTDPFEAILEIKNVDGLVFKRSWVSDEDGAIEAPPHIEIQLQYQMLVSGIHKGYIAALVGGNELHIIEREAIREIHVKLYKKVKAFWQSIEDNEAPSPNFEKDAEFIAKLYSFAHPEKVIESTERIDELVAERHSLLEVKKSNTKALDTNKAELLTLVGDAEKVTGKGYTLSLGMIGPSDVSYTRKGYRNFKPNFKKDYKND